MQSLALAHLGDRGRVSAARIMVLAALVILGSLFTDRQASAAAVLNAAAATANAGLSACSNNRGKELHNCVANVLDRMSNEISAANVPDTQRALQTAASQLRAASTKAQAVSAIAQCQSVIAGALRQVKAAAGGFVRGWGDSGLASIAGVLARAARLIQSKG